MNKTPLPIDPYLPDIIKQLDHTNILLIKASPGSGKTTRLPWEISRHHEGQIIVLEPRRLAARMAAQRIVDEHGLSLGDEVGYHFRFEKKESEKTKLLFMTEGTFLKSKLIPKLSQQIKVVVLDEFHERHIETDIALAALRPYVNDGSLKLIIMSATLDHNLVNFFPESKLIEIEAPRFPVQIHYLENTPSILNQSLEKKVYDSLKKVKSDGDILIFIPGFHEMTKICHLIGDEFGDVYFLHGEMSKEEQEQVLKISPGRKIILATNIAESSITIPGIKIVIDSGIQREAFYSPWHGMKSLKDTPCPKSSCIQRAGRAGRVSEGECYRLFSQRDYDERSPHAAPEIHRSDLSETFLFTKSLPYALDWFESPSEINWRKAQDLCQSLGLINKNDELTLIGKEVSHFPIDLRLSRVLYESRRLSNESKKKIISFICETFKMDHKDRLESKLKKFFELKEEDSFPWERAILTGFIDQVAKYRPKNHDFIHRSGKIFKAHSSFKDLTEGFYLLFEISRRDEVMNCFYIQEDWLFEIEPFPFSEEIMTDLKPSISFKRVTKLGSLVYEEEVLDLTYNDEMMNRLEEQSQHILSQKLDEWLREERNQKMAYLLKHTKKEKPKITSKNFFQMNQKFSWNGIDDYFLSFFQEYFHEELESFPSQIKIGQKIFVISYPDSGEPFLEAPIQDFYGINSTPVIAQGKIELVLKLLGPHKRPLQVTKDLSGFWARTYKEMKKELERDYPKHYWPDEPQNAKPYLLKRHLGSPT